MKYFDDIKWIFFDVGSTLVDETIAYDNRLSEMLVNSSLDIDEVRQKRLEFFRQGYDGHSTVISHFNLQKTPWPTEDERLFESTPIVLHSLVEKGYKLGIVANQSAGLIKRLTKWDIADYFVVVISADVGVSKPALEMFQKAIALSGCKPSQTVMVGDRLDNDVIPAKQCGMNTVWVRNGLTVNAPKSFANGKANVIIDDIQQLMEIF